MALIAGLRLPLEAKPAIEKFSDWKDAGGGEVRV
jgi:hypothetical protein